LLLASWVRRSAPEQPEVGLAEFLVCAAVYIGVYWRLIGKLD
jgi:hypothetical protein